MTLPWTVTTIYLMDLISKKKINNNTSMFQKLMTLMKMIQTARTKELGMKEWMRKATHFRRMKRQYKFIP